MSEPLVTLRGRAPRRLAWRLPLLGLLLVGVIALRQVDLLLRREYMKEATTQAVQTDALLESFVKQRIALLNGLRAMIASAPTSQEAETRFTVLGRGIAADAPEMVSLYLLDSSGRVTARLHRSDAELVLGGANHGAYATRAAALETARETRDAAVTRTVELVDGSRGMLIYVPIEKQGRQPGGFIGASFAYRSLFYDALAGQLQGHFGYRVRDQAGAIIAESPDHPASVQARVARDVRLPGGAAWRLEVAVPRLQPFMARLVTWIVGVLLLTLATLVVLREEARARRAAEHSWHLEQLSRNLLDANARLEERTRQLADANRAKSRFLANVSHELRTPLNAIVGYNSLALDGVYGHLDEALQGAHDRIGVAAEHLLGLVNEVLDLAKIEVGRMTVEPEPLDFAALLDGIVTVLEPVALAKGLRVDVVLDQTLPPVVSDPRHVRQIVMNLASNAVKFTDRGRVTLSAMRDRTSPDGRVLVSVRDTGIGIAPGDLERIFDEFEQVRPSGRGDSMQRGTGLGLAIARKLARILGGEIRVESRVGDGSRFTLELPTMPPAPTDEAGPADEMTPYAVGGATGEFADDDDVAPASDAPEDTTHVASRGLDVETPSR